MANYIYSRISCSLQSLDPQLFALKEMFPKAEVISEVASGAKQRPMLESLIKSLKKDDRLIVAALDRLGRRTLDLLQTMEFLEKKGVIVKSVREGFDLSTPIGRLVTQILASVSEMERNLICERTRAGLIAAKMKGQHLGRPNCYSDDLKNLGVSLVIEGGYTLKMASKQTGISHWYLGKLVRKAKKG